MLDIPEISKIKLDEGDTLVFRFKERISQKEMRNIGEQIQLIFPGTKYILLDNDSELEVLHSENIAES